ncbi:MAG: type II secretion system protein [Minisyncoccia bacterium]
MNTQTTWRVRGMTLIEMLVSITLFVFAMVSVVASVRSFYRTNTYAVEQSSAVTSAQRGVESMVKAFREAAYSSNGAYPIVAIGANEVTFYADIDTDPYVEKVRYFVQGTSLLRELTDPSGDPLVYGASQVTSLVSDTVRNIEQNIVMFRYYDSSGVQIANFTEISKVRFIEMNIVVNVDPNRLPNQLILRSTAALRNLK